MRMIDSRRAFSMSQMMQSSGARPGSQLLMFALTRADRDLATRLRIEIGDPVLRMRRLRTANDVPFCIELSSVPASLVPCLIAQDLANNTHLYQILRDRYGIVPTGSRQRNQCGARYGGRCGASRRYARNQRAALQLSSEMRMDA